jgi:hypothetical protein
MALVLTVVVSVAVAGLAVSWVLIDTPVGVAGSAGDHLLRPADAVAGDKGRRVLRDLLDGLLGLCAVPVYVLRLQRLHQPWYGN